jgi:tRNA1(Val) A37 N6-methylase TrmN6
MNDAAFTIDAFHRGRFHLVQPARGGHRSGIDAMLLAACVPDGFAGHCVDLGSGAGAAGLAVLSRCPLARMTLVENDPVMADCALRTLALPRNAELAARATIIRADVTLTGAARRAAGLADDTFDFAILNPPFNDARDRQTPDARKQAAHVMEGGMFEAWMRTVTAIVRPGSGYAMIARPESVGEMLNAVGARFGALTLRAVHAHEGAEAIRLLVSGVKGSRARLVIAPPHILHAKGSDAFLPFADAVNNGQASLA